MSDTWTLINDRMTAMKDRNTRMDDTVKLLQWDDSPYKLVKPDGKTELRDAISVTPNLPKVFAHGVISDLMGGNWQTVVEGKVSDRKAHLIEEFVEDNLAQADEQVLARYDIPSLFGWLCNHVCIRWAIGVRWLSQVEDGEYKIDCFPVDMRWTPFVRGKWVAPITWNSKDALEEELEKYEKLAKGGVGAYNKIPLSEAKDIEVRDFWDNEKNELWVDKKLVYSQKNPFGYPPFVIVIPASGFMLRDKGFMKHEGEDILYFSAGLYKELARSVSLEQTSGYAGLYPGYEYEEENPDATPTVPPPAIDETLKRKKGELHQPVPRGDINRAGQTARVDIQAMISAGSPLSPKEYNTPPSAILLAGETELINRLQNARKDALGIFKSQLARMMIEQFIKAEKGELLIGKKGKRIKYSASKLGNPDDYNISYHLSVKSKRQELANLAEFAAVYGKLPLRWNLANILMVDDPDGIERELELEEARRADPAISLHEMALRYVEEAEEMEDDDEANAKLIQAKMLVERGVSVIRDRMAPAQPALPESARVPEVAEPKGGGNLLPALGGGQGEGGVPSKEPEEIKG